MRLYRARRWLCRRIMGEDQFFNADASLEIDRLTVLVEQRDETIREQAFTIDRLEQELIGALVRLDFWENGTSTEGIAELVSSER